MKNQSEFTVKIGRNDITVRHYYSDGEVVVYNNSRAIEQISHDEHESAALTFQQLKQVLTAIEALG